MYSTVIGWLGHHYRAVPSGKNLTDAVSEVRDAISLIRSDLPAEIREPHHHQITISGRPIHVYSVQRAPGSGWDEQQLSWFVDNTFNKQLMTIVGVGQVKRIGGVSREVQVELLPERMQALGVTAADVSMVIGQANRMLPGGRGGVGGSEQSVRTVASARSAADLAAMRRFRCLPATRCVWRCGPGARHRGRTACAGAGRRAVYGHGRNLPQQGRQRTRCGARCRRPRGRMREQHPVVQITRMIDNAEPVRNNFPGQYEPAL